MTKDVVKNPELEENPKQALRETASSSTLKIYIHLGFHPYVEDPFITCTVEEIVQKHQKNVLYLIFLSPKLNLPLVFSRL